jgi:hypothetical protein
MTVRDRSRDRAPWRHAFRDHRGGKVPHASKRPFRMALLEQDPVTPLDPRDRHGRTDSSGTDVRDPAERERGRGRTGRSQRGSRGVQRWRPAHDLIPIAGDGEGSRQGTNTSPRGRCRPAREGRTGARRPASRSRRRRAPRDRRRRKRSLPRCSVPPQADPGAHRPFQGPGLDARPLPRSHLDAAPALAGSSRAAPGRENVVPRARASDLNVDSARGTFQYDYRVVC